MFAVEAGHGYGNLHSQSRAAPHRPGCEYFHFPLFHRMRCLDSLVLQKRLEASPRKNR
jgi:hypothetical protein